MTDTDVDTGAGSLSAEETAYFESGGESAIPGDTGADNPGNGSDGSGADKGGDQANKGGDKAISTVPLAALHEERTKRRDLDKSNRELQTQIAELKGKFSIIERLGLPGGDEQQQAPKGPPKAEDDIFGAVNHVGETLVQMQKRLDDADAATKAQGEQTAFVNNYRADAAKFEATTPDFKDGYNFILNSRAQELMSIGYDNPADPNLTPDEKQAAAKALHEALVADEYAIAEMAFTKGKSPAEMLYALAKQRGYKPGAAPGATAEPGKGAETLERIERGQAANKSLNSTGGSSGDGDMTAEALIAMPLEEFEAWTAKNPAKAKRIMGG